MKRGEGLRSAVEVARKFNRNLSLHRNLRDGGDGPIVGAIGRWVDRLGGREWRGLKFFQCPITGYAVMKVPEFSYLEDFRDLEEMAWEAKIENQGIGGPSTSRKMERVREVAKRNRGVRRWCGCGCGQRVYGGRRWVMGHNGRVEGWFERGIVPPGFEYDYEKWRMTGCLAKLEELPQPGNI